MATKIKQITEEVGLDGLLFGNWLSQQGLDSKEQFKYLQSGWLERIARGVYKIAGSHPTLYSAVSCYNTQLGKQYRRSAECIGSAWLHALCAHGQSGGVPVHRQCA